MPPLRLSTERPGSRDRAYRQRVLLSTAVVLLLAIALVRWWPAVEPSAPKRPFNDRASETIAVKEVQQTSHSAERVPPPPAPAPPVVVPNDVLIKDPVEFEDSKLSLNTDGEDARRQEGTAEAATASRRPDTGARLLRAVQPDYPSDARKRKVRARVVVAVDVTPQGQTENPQIQERLLLRDDGPPRRVGALGHGIEEAALAAARRTLFRPARANGKPVATRTTITFTFGGRSGR